ncbi:hypothetical protein NicSoilC12_32340 [Arthrobacter sp. NicSoilC12]|nr:hypothetical protein NicSoilC12_32340 [Arthrobacter sp. NicSoilC12]
MFTAADTAYCLQGSGMDVTFRRVPDQKPSAGRKPCCPNQGCSAAADHKSVGEIMAVIEDPAAAGKTAFRFAAPISSTEHPKDVWRPGSTTTSGAASPLNDSMYADPVISPAPRAFDRSLWPHLY